jgi:competence protein ComEC
MKKLHALRVHLVGLLIILPLLLSSAAISYAEAPAEITITFIDVGQGDATLIRDGAGFDVLIDGGNKSAGETVIEHIQSAGVDDLEMVIASHGDRDHVGGLIVVLESDEILVENVYFNGYPGDTLTWQEFEAAVIAEGLLLNPMQYPQSQSWGALDMEVLNPPDNLVDPEQNEASIVLIIDYAQTRIILPGDIDSSVEQLLPGRTSSLQAVILKVAHHGSKFSTSTAFLSNVQPDEAIISVGQNSYAHPAPETLERLSQAGTRVLRTDMLGSITLISDGSSYDLLPKIVFIPLLFGNY